MCNPERPPAKRAGARRRTSAGVAATDDPASWEGQPMSSATGTPFRPIVRRCLKCDRSAARNECWVM